MRSSKIITPAVAMVATVLLAACNTAASKLAPNTSASCVEQFHAWRSSEQSALKQLANFRHRLQAAVSVQDIEAVRRGLHDLGPVVTALQAHPIPKCADPAGYWHKFLARVKAGADNAGAASGLAGLLLAVAPLKEAKRLEIKLSAELKRTVHLKAGQG